MIARSAITPTLRFRELPPALAARIAGPRLPCAACTFLTDGWRGSFATLQWGRLARGALGGVCLLLGVGCFDRADLPLVPMDPRRSAPLAALRARPDRGHPAHHPDFSAGLRDHPPWSVVARVEVCLDCEAAA